MEEVLARDERWGLHAQAPVVPAFRLPHCLVGRGRGEVAHGWSVEQLPAARAPGCVVAERRLIVALVDHELGLVLLGEPGEALAVAPAADGEDEVGEDDGGEGGGGEDEDDGYEVHGFLLSRCVVRATALRAG